MRQPLCLEGKGSVAGNNGRVGNTREVGREALCDAVRELLVLVLLPQIGERQHNDGERAEPKLRQQACFKYDQRRHPLAARKHEPAAGYFSARPCLCRQNGTDILLRT